MRTALDFVWTRNPLADEALRARVWGTPLERRVIAEQACNFAWLEPRRRGRAPTWGGDYIVASTWEQFAIG